jgi:hypothetical protein
MEIDMSVPADPSDITSKDYDFWLQAVFDHPASETLKHWYLADDAVLWVSNAKTFIEYLTRLFSEFKTLTNQYSMAQIDQGIWLLLGGAGTIEPDVCECLFSSESDLRTTRIMPPVIDKVKCLRAMYYVYSDFVSALPRDEQIPNCFYMWWDLICCEFWSYVRQRRSKPLEPQRIPGLIEQAYIIANTSVDDLVGETERNSPERTARLNSFGVEANFEPDPEYADLDSEERQLIDTIFDTLCKIIALPDVDIQAFALHGLGHAHHPGVPAVVQRYIDEVGAISGQTEASIEWLKQCRDGTVM